MDATYTINIDLNQRRTLSDDKFTFFAPWLFKELEQYIKERIIEIESFQKKHPNNNHQGEDFKSLKKFDAIVVEGLRGSGKTTFLEMISKFARELNLPVKVVDLIDTNEILSRKNIILVLLKRLEEIVEEKEYILNYYDENYHVNLKEIKADLIKIRDTIESHLFGEHFSDIDRAEYFQELAESLRLAENIHYLSKKICDLLKVKSIIVPIDDLDMDFTFYEKVLSDIRLYMTTPYIIPVVAFDVNQIYLLLKKKYYQVFGLSLLDEPKIRKNPEFSFLRKLTSEFIQKLFPPSRKIVIPDMLDYYKYIMENKQNIKVFFKFRNSKLNGSFFPNNEIKLPFQELTRAFMNVVYGYDGKDIDNPEDYHLVNYLKGKTLRSIIDDYKSFLKGIKEKSGEDNNYIYFLFSTEELKKRFRPYNKEIFSNKYDATKWFWEKYIELVHNRENSGKSYLVLDEIEKTLIINPDDSVSEIRKEKTYVRLFLQDFFMSEINIGFLKEKKGKDSKREIIISKIIDVSGYFELALRTVFPAILFENLVNTNQIDIGSFPIESLISFYRDDNRYSLEESLQNISSWTYFYGIDNENFLAKEINNRETSLYRNKHKKFYVEVYDLYIGDIKFLLSPFKYMYYLLLRLEEEDLKIPTTIDSSLGIISLMELSRNLAQNIALIFAKKGNDDLACDKELKDLDEKHKKYVRYHENLQFMGTIISIIYFHLLLNIIKNIKQFPYNLENYQIESLVYSESSYRKILWDRSKSCAYILTGNLILSILKKIISKEKERSVLSAFIKFLLRELTNSQEFIHTFMLYGITSRVDSTYVTWLQNQIIEYNEGKYIYRKRDYVLYFLLYNKNEQQTVNNMLFKQVLLLLDENVYDLARFFSEALFRTELHKHEMGTLQENVFRGLLYEFYIHEFLPNISHENLSKILKEEFNSRNRTIKALIPYINILLNTALEKQKWDTLRSLILELEKKGSKEVLERINDFMRKFNYDLNLKQPKNSLKRIFYIVNKLYELLFRSKIGISDENYKNIVHEYLATKKENYIIDIINIFVYEQIPENFKSEFFTIKNIEKISGSKDEKLKYKKLLIKADIALDFVNFVIEKIKEEYKNKQK